MKFKIRKNITPITTAFYFQLKKIVSQLYSFLYYIDDNQNNNSDIIKNQI